jgi:hypothetical protein
MPGWMREERRAQRAAELARREALQATLEAQRKLMLQIVDAGCKAMARKLHPDVGGSHEEMTRLNMAAEILRERL